MKKRMLMIVSLLVILITMTSCSQKTYKVIFLDYDDVIITERTVEGFDFNNLEVLPENPKREGYDFIEWIIEYDKAEEVIYARATYEMKRYKIVFDSDGGTNVESQNIIRKETAIKPDDPIKEGYTFEGWYVDGDTKWLFSVYEVITDLTLKANWIPKEYQINVYNNNQELIDQYSQLYDEQLIMPVYGDIEGYAFIDNSVITNHETKTINISPIFEKQKYEISFYNEGLLINSYNILFDEEIIFPEVGNKDGYRFNGWLENRSEFSNTKMPSRNLKLDVNWDLIRVWDGSFREPETFQMIDGSIYYEIATGEELAYIQYERGVWLDYNYILISDIKLNDFEISIDEEGDLLSDTSQLNLWNPINELKGNFNGNNYTISGLYINRPTSSYNGLFGRISGNIYDLNLEKSYIKGSSYTGGVIGSATKTGQRITNVTFNGVVIGEQYTGGIIGYGSRIDPEELVNHGFVLGTYYVGGVLGYKSAYDGQNLTNYGDVSGIENIGGIVGYSSYSTSNSINYGDVSGIENIGGIVGLNGSQSSISGTNHGNIFGETNVGGLVGKDSNSGGTYTYSLWSGRNYGIVSGTEYVGGIVGYAYQFNISNSTNYANVIGENFVGGVVGYTGSIFGKGAVTNTFYLQTEEINVNIKGFGNFEENIPGVVEAISN